MNTHLFEFGNEPALVIKTGFSGKIVDTMLENEPKRFNENTDEISIKDGITFRKLSSFYSQNLIEVLSKTLFEGTVRALFMVTE